MAQSQLTVLDFVVFASVLLISSGIGIFYALKERCGKNKATINSYLMGDRAMALIPVALSLLVSFQSGILILGASSEMYTKGVTFWWAAIGISLSALLTCFIFVPIFYELRLTSVYEYLELRFKSRLVRQLGSFLYILVTILYLSIVIYAPSVALNAVSDLPLWLLIILSGAICTFYVSIGGIKAVVWTDAVQAVFMLAGVLGVLIEGLLRVGGLRRTWAISEARGRIKFESSADPFAYMTVWGAVFGQVFSWLGWYGINQSSVQRYCGMRTMRDGQLAVLLNIPGLFLVKTLICLCGLVMFVYYVDCDPLASGILAKRDQLLPYFVLDVLDGIPGLGGLFVACLYSGTLSTVSSGLNSLAAVTWEDFLKFNSRAQRLSQKQATLLTKILALAYGLTSTVVSFMAPYLGGVLQAALSTMGAVNGPLTGIFLLGVFCPWANRNGALSGAAVSFAISAWICVGATMTQPHSDYLPTSVDGCNANFTNATTLVATTVISNMTLSHSGDASSAALDGLNKFYSLSSVLYDMTGILIVFLVGVPVSLLTRTKDAQDIDLRLLTPFVAKLLNPARHSALNVDKEMTNMKVPQHVTEDEESSALLEATPVKI